MLKKLQTNRPYKKRGKRRTGKQSENDIPCDLGNTRTIRNNNIKEEDCEDGDDEEEGNDDEEAEKEKKRETK